MGASLERASRGKTAQCSTAPVISDIHKMILIFVLCVRTKTRLHSCKQRAAQRKKITKCLVGRRFPFFSISPSIKEPIWKPFHKTLLCGDEMTSNVLKIFWVHGSI